MSAGNLQACMATCCISMCVRNQERMIGVVARYRTGVYVQVMAMPNQITLNLMQVTMHNMAFINNSATPIRVQSDSRVTLDKCKVINNVQGLAPDAKGGGLVRVMTVHCCASCVALPVLRKRAESARVYIPNAVS